MEDRKIARVTEAQKNRVLGIYQYAPMTEKAATARGL